MSIDFVNTIAGLSGVWTFSRPGSIVVVAMMFAAQLRDRIRRGEITCSVRIWMRPHVKVGGRYALPPGDIEVEALLPIRLADITPSLARKSGFRDVDDLLATAKHGRGESVYLVHFRYVPPKRTRRKPGSRRRPRRT